MTPAQRVGVCHHCRHREQNCNGPCICLITGRDIRDMADADSCPLAWDVTAEVPVVHVRVSPSPRPTPAVRLSSTLRLRPEGSSPKSAKPIDWLPLWTAFHTHIPSADTLAWLAAFTAHLPCGECRRGFRAWVKANPPQIDSQASWFEWSWRAHEHINIKLGKPAMSIADAIDRWKPIANA
jgi:hypothetical protein